MIIATVVTSTEELQQIIDLQRKNLKQYITKEEKDQQGFLTMEFSMPMIQQLHDLAPSVIIKDDNKVVAFAIVLLQEGRTAYPDLEPMFKNFENLQWENKPLHEYSFYVMGQICIDKDHRGKGLFDMLYQQHRKMHSKQFDFVVTEISTSNYRSLSAHRRVGFKTINTFRDKMDEWDVVIWDWK